MCLKLVLVCSRGADALKKRNLRVLNFLSSHQLTCLLSNFQAEDAPLCLCKIFKFGGSVFRLRHSAEEEEEEEEEEEVAWTMNFRFRLQFAESGWPFGFQQPL